MDSTTTGNMGLGASEREQDIIRSALADATLGQSEATYTNQFNFLARWMETGSLAQAGLDALDAGVDAEGVKHSVLARYDQTRLTPDVQRARLAALESGDAERSEAAKRVLIPMKVLRMGLEQRHGTVAEVQYLAGMHDKYVSELRGAQDAVEKEEGLMQVLDVRGMVRAKVEQQAIRAALKMYQNQEMEPAMRQALMDSRGVLEPIDQALERGEPLRQAIDGLFGRDARETRRDGVTRNGTQVRR